MLQPVSRILVINDERLVLRELIKGLNSAAKSLDNPLGIVFSGVTTAQEALQAIEQDGDIQAVVVDDTLYTLDSDRNGARTSQNGSRTPASVPS
jgi:arginine decarboxylase